MNQGGIAYQNKDITSKLLAENFKGKTFRVYGLDIPEMAEKPSGVQFREECRLQRHPDRPDIVLVRYLSPLYIACVDDNHPEKKSASP